MAKLLKRPPIIAAIIGRDGVALDDGTLIEQPPNWWVDPVAVLRIIGETCAMDATILLDMPKWPLEEFDSKQVVRDGWEFSELRDDWTTFRRLFKGAVQTVTIGLLPNVNGYKLFDAKADPWPTIVERLAKYRKVAGCAWRGRPGVNGVQHLRNLYQDKRPGHQPRWFLSRGPGSPEFRSRMRPAGDLQWSRHPTAVELRADDGAAIVGQLDVNAQYLAAAQNAMLAWGELEHDAVTVFDGKRAGYWCVNAPVVQWPAQLPPLFATRLIQPDGTVWLTTPIMGMLLERGCSPEIIESWTAAGRRLLVPWAEHYRNARLGMLGDVSDPAVLAAVKSTVNESVGLFNRRGGRLYRPDWQHSIIDTARANLLRKVNAVWESSGEVPLRVHYDSVWYINNAAAAEALTHHMHPQQIGKLRYVGSTALASEDWKGNPR